MKILHIIAGMPPESGVAAVVTRLAVEQRGLGHEVCVACTGQENCLITKLQDCVSEKQVREVTFRQNWPHFLYFSWGMLVGLGKEIKDADVVHVHSSWTFPVWWGAWLALRHKKTLVMSPHGGLDPVRLKHSGWKKKLVGGMDRWLLKRASVIVATCEAENAWIEAFLKCANARMLECGNGGGEKCENARMRECGNGEGEKCANARMRECGNGTPRQGEADPRAGGMPKIVVIPNGVGEMRECSNVRIRELREVR